MPRKRKSSIASAHSGDASRPEEELGSMYDYLAKVILLGPSGCGKSCLLHRFVKNEWRVLSSQTIGVEFASKIIKVGTGNRRKRIKLQLWDTAGTERFRSVSRSYYRGAAGALLIYDISNWNTFTSLGTFLNDARALASPDLTLLLVGNKADLSEGIGQGREDLIDVETTPNSLSSQQSSYASHGSTSSRIGPGSQQKATTAPEGREVEADVSSRWAGSNGIPVSVEASALNGDNVDEIFARLARMILTKIELGEIDPDDPMSGIQYGDAGGWGIGTEDGGSIKSGMTVEGGSVRRKRRGGAGRAARGGVIGGLSDWGQVFRPSAFGNRGCC